MINCKCRKIFFKFETANSFVGTDNPLGVGRIQSLEVRITTTTMKLHLL